MAQTKKSLEIILVDDGATDQSGAICDEYAKKDERIRVVHKPNGGLTSAWKAGAEIAEGRYLGFVDSDDWIDEDMYKRMWESACKYNSDIVVCGLVFDYEDTSIPIVVVLADILLGCFYIGFFLEGVYAENLLV
jgi:glycosyltransferase involved in cell wall biosynthesis